MPAPDSLVTGSSVLPAFLSHNGMPPFDDADLRMARGISASYTAFSALGALAAFSGLVDGKLGGSSIETSTSVVLLVCLLWTLEFSS